MGWMNCIFVSSQCDNWSQDWSNDFHIILNMKSLKKFYINEEIWLWYIATN